MSDEKEVELTLNGSPISREALEEEKKKVASQKGVRLIELSANTFVRRLKD